MRAVCARIELGAHRLFKMDPLMATQPGNNRHGSMPNFSAICSNTRGHGSLSLNGTHTRLAVTSIRVASFRICSRIVERLRFCPVASGFWGSKNETCDARTSRERTSLATGCERINRCSFSRETSAQSEYSRCRESPVMPSLQCGSLPG